MPLGELILGDGPDAARGGAEAAKSLRHRDFLTVALVVPESAGFPDNWIYVHSPDVRLGRVQNFGSWSPWMVAPGTTCLGLEYFVNEGDDRCGRWPTTSWSRFAADELSTIGLLDPSGRRARATSSRVPKAYPVYDTGVPGQHRDDARVARRARPQRPPGRPQRHAPLQQPGPLDADGDAGGREHPRRRRPRPVGGQRRRGVPRGALDDDAVGWGGRAAPITA